MAKIDKIIDKMIRNPYGVTFHELKKALEYAGYMEVRIRSSHHHFRNDQGLITTVKRENPVDPAAVKDALKRLGR